jgi:hypothetical protein
MIRAQKEPERFAFEHRGDSKLVAAILAAPPFLSGLSQEAVDRIKAVALEALHPAEVREIAALEDAEKVAANAVDLARERIVKRAELVKGQDGKWRHKSEGE